MAYDEALADTLRGILAEAGEVPREQRMFGGLAFMIADSLAVAASREGLLVRVGEDMHQEALSRPGTRVMEMRGRPMIGWIYVNVDGARAEDIREWVALAVANAHARPAKGARGTKPGRSVG